MKVVLTGKFKHGSRKEVAELLKSHGIAAGNSLNAEIDYLINGSFGSDAYSKGKYGNKHIKATQLGVPIVTEDEFFAQLKKGLVSQDQINAVDMDVTQSDLEHNTPSRVAGKDKLRFTKIPGVELTIQYTNQANQFTTRKIGVITAHPDAQYFNARSPGESQSRSFRYDRVSDAVDNFTGEVIENVEEYIKGLIDVDDEIHDIKRRAGLI